MNDAGYFLDRRDCPCGFPFHRREDLGGARVFPFPGFLIFGSIGGGANIQMPAKKPDRSNQAEKEFSRKINLKIFSSSSLSEADRSEAAKRRSAGKRSDSKHYPRTRNKRGPGHRGHLRVTFVSGDK